MTKEVKIRIGALTVCLLMFTALLLPLLSFDASASDLDDKKSEMESLGAQLDALEAQMEQLESDQAGQEAVASNATEQLAIIAEQTAILLEQMTNKREEIATKQQEIDAQLRDIASSEELLADRLRSMYITRDSGVMSTILSANSFAEFLTAADAAARVAEADNLLITEMDAAYKSLTLQEEALATQLLDLEEQERQLAEAEANYASVWQVANNTIDQIEADKAAAQVQEEIIYEQYVAARESYEEAIRQANANSTGVYVGGEYGWPVPSSYYISSYFGWRTLYGVADYHTGIDIARGELASIDGHPIVAANDGIVSLAVWSNVGYGNYLIVDHGGNQLTLYGHCSSLNVAKGDVVTKGQQIATVGSTGNSTGPHLHFEIRLNGAMVNPEPYLKR